MLYNGATVIDVRDAQRTTGAIGLQSAHPEDPAGAFGPEQNSNNNFGLITSTANSPRQMRFGLKLYW